MFNLSSFTQTGLLVEKNVLSERENYYIFNNGNHYYDFMYAKQDRITSLNGEWMFKACSDTAEDMDEYFYTDNYIGPGFSEVNLPGVQATGAYIRKIELTSEQLEYKQYLVFNGVDSDFYLWINGEFAGFRTESSGMAEFDVSTMLTEGLNTFTILAINERGDEASDGIWGDIYLMGRPKRHIRNFSINTELDKKNENAMITVRINQEASGMKAHCYLLDQEDKCVSDYKLFCGKVSFFVPKPQLWNAEQPYLYTMLIVTDEETIVKQIGIHTRAIIDSKLYINECPITAAADLTEDMSNLSHAGADKIYVELARLKQHNINTLILKEKHCTPRLMNQCLRLGFYVINTDRDAMIRFDNQQEQEELPLNPLGAIMKDQNDLRISITNGWDFKNLMDEVYIQSDIIKDNQVLDTQKTYMLDVPAKQSGSIQINRDNLEQGQYQLHVTFRQGVESGALWKGHIIGEELFEFQI